MSEPEVDGAGHADGRVSGHEQAEHGVEHARPSEHELSWAETVQVVPVVLRTGLMAGQRLVTWTVSSSMLVTQWAASDPWGGLRVSILGSLRAALGIDDLEAELQRLTGHATPAAEPSPEAPVPALEVEPPSLRERGRRLLVQSVALEDDEEHPAFGMVLEQIAPDEMRLLRVLSRDGDQAAVDVEAAGVLSGGGRVVARRITLLAEKAGCKHPDRLPVYLDNLERLGVVHLDDHPLGDGDYEVVEAQPRVDEAREEASRGARARLVRRRLALTDFGRAFCERCLPN